MREPSVLIEAYRRILRSARRGVGTKLTREECRAMSFDQSIEQAIATEDEMVADELEAKNGR